MFAGVRLLWWKLRSGERFDEADTSSEPPAFNAASPTENNCATIETELTTSSPEDGDGDDRMLLIEERYSASLLSVMGSPSLCRKMSMGRDKSS